MARTPPRPAPRTALLTAAGYDHEVPRAACAARLNVLVTEELVLLLLPELIKAQAMVEAEIACSAARACNEEGHIVAGSAPIYKRFFAKNLLFQLAFFSSKLFLGFAGKVAAAEERELAGEAEPAKAAEGIALSPITRRLDERLARRLDPMKTVLDFIVGAVSQAAPATAAAAVGAAAASALGAAAAASGRRLQRRRWGPRPQRRRCRQCPAAARRSASR